MKNFMTAFMMAWGNFLSIPCPKKVWENNLKKEMLTMLPIIGLIAGFIEFCIAHLFFRLSLPVPISAFFLTLFAFGISGFMHADGFMDCCDAILSRRDLAERQRILKDSRVGAFAVISMILLAIGTFSAFFAIMEKVMASNAISYTVAARLLPIISTTPLILISVMSRATAGSAVLSLPSLSTSQYAESKDDTEDKIINHGVTITVGVLAIFLILVVITFVLGMKISGEAARMFLFALVVPGVITLLATRLSIHLASKNLGGMSGDIAGFGICMGELVGLIALAIVL